ncbi:MAG: hypothetical protein V8R10_07670 [Christensenellales bacterium]
MENQESIYEEKQGNLLTGILGALLGALIGTALWVLVGVWGYVASIVAWLTAFLAGKGYDLLHGRPGKAKAITIIVMLILSICVGTVGTATVIMVQSYNQQISEMNTFEQARIQKYGPTVEEYVLESMFMERGHPNGDREESRIGDAVWRAGRIPDCAGRPPQESRSRIPSSRMRRRMAHRNQRKTRMIRTSIWMPNHIKQSPYRKINPVRRFFAFMVFCGCSGQTPPPMRR